MDQSLLVFITVTEKRNFSRAAEHLHMTQPAVSQHIQLLERTMGTRLLERSNKYVRLNKAGEIVYHHAKEIISQYSRMQNLVDDLLNLGKGDLSIGASYTFGEYILPHCIASLREQYPLIQPNITIGNTKHIAELILNQRLDVGIVEGDFRHEDLAIEPFAEDYMFVVIPSSHSCAHLETITLDQLTSDTWIVRETGSGTRAAAESMFKKYHFHPHSRMEFGSTQIIKESVEAGLGISLLSQWVVRKEVSLGSLKLLRVNGHPIVRKFSIVMQKSEFRMRAAEVFVDTLKNSELLKFY